MKNRVYKYYSDLRIIEYDQPSGITNGHSPTLDYRAVHNQYENLKKKKIQLYTVPIVKPTFGSDALFVFVLFHAFIFLTKM